jgi:hypothetical protein
LQELAERGAEVEPNFGSLPLGFDDPTLARPWVNACIVDMPHLLALVAVHTVVPLEVLLNETLARKLDPQFECPGSHSPLLIECA